MNSALDDLAPRRDGVTIPVIWVAIAVSAALHALVISGWMPWLRLTPSEKEIPPELSAPLSVRIIPLPGPGGPPPSAAPSARLSTPPSATARRAAPPRSVARPQAASPVLTQQAPAPDVAKPESTVVAPAPSAGAGDFASLIEARRRARAESASSDSSSAPPATPVEDDATRRNRIAMANLNPQEPMAFGYDPKRSGGVFQIDRMSADYAEFVFFGWHLPAKRKMMQRIEVRKGSHPDIRVAVVRRMIAIIREYEKEDFQWESYRLNRTLTLSARPRDNAGLEDFMMREFFDDPRRTR